MSITASPTNKSGSAINYNGLHAFVRDRVENTVTSALYKRSPLLAYIAGKTKQDTNLGRPGALGFIGSGVLGDVERNIESGSEKRISIQTNESATGKWMGTRDTMPSTGTGSADQDVSTAVFRWSKRVDAIKIYNTPMDLQTMGEDKILDLAAFAVDSGMEVHLNAINEALWHGTPSDTEADTWDNLLGVIHAMNDDTNHYYGNLVVDGTYWFGCRDATAYNASLNLIDRANFNPGETQPRAADRGNGFDLALTSGSNYFKIKQEALARGQSLVVTDLPVHPEVGATQEAIRYGKTWITYDPLLDTGNDWSSDDSLITSGDTNEILALFNTDDWVFSTNPNRNFSVSQMVNTGLYTQGGDDATIGYIQTLCRLYCRKPWRQFLYLTVT